MSALWFVYVPRPWLILLSSQPCLNPQPATHQSQLQFKLPGNGKIRLKLVIFSLQLLLLARAFQLHVHTAENSHSNHSQLNRLPHTGTPLNRCRLARVKWTSNSISPLSPSPPIRLSPFTLSRHSLHLCSFHPSFLLTNFALYTYSVSRRHALLSGAVHPLASCFSFQKRLQRALCTNSIS